MSFSTANQCRKWSWFYYFFLSFVWSYWTFKHSEERFWFLHTSLVFSFFFFSQSKVTWVYNHDTDLLFLIIKPQLVELETACILHQFFHCHVPEAMPSAIRSVTGIHSTALLPSLAIWISTFFWAITLCWRARIPCCGPKPSKNVNTCLKWVLSVYLIC